MKFVRFSLIGIVLQGMGLTVFILISGGNIAMVGKPVVIGLTAVSVMLLLWHSAKQSNTLTAIVLFPALLALGYVVAFYVVGVLEFRGLLHGMEFSANYLLSVLRVAGIVFMLYAMGSVLIYFTSKVLKARAHD